MRALEINASRNIPIPFDAMSLRIELKSNDVASEVKSYSTNSNQGWKFSTVFLSLGDR